MYTNEQAFVNCLVPFSGDLGLARRGSMKDAATLRAEMSVGALPAFQDLTSLIETDNLLPELPAQNLPPPSVFNETRLAKRQCEPWPVQTTVLHGDGNPHQNYFHQQRTSPVQCSQNGCSATYTHGDSFTVGWSASFPIFKWIGGGFNVGMTWTTSEGTTCNGTPGEEVCVWYNTAHTAYTVENWTTDDVCMNKERMESLSIVKSANAFNRGGKILSDGRAWLACSCIRCSSRLVAHVRYGIKESAADKKEEPKDDLDEYVTQRQINAVTTTFLNKNGKIAKLEANDKVNKDEIKSLKRKVADLEGKLADLGGKLEKIHQSIEQARALTYIKDEED
ncbi:hypothetical protein KVT40_006187 [Elsinoe batatas]|uniref:Uncharacterized protein n=1 Tax=Elsinoe batatas TaxID=2601811 RepID=A0A8K0PDJ9_9PEZI|nr:hypothetical protein KVT40_006187 [Elsinoe batatas]